MSSEIARRVTRADEREVMAAALDDVQTALTRQTDIISRLAGGLLNNVLDVLYLPIPASGYLSRDYGTAAGSIVVANPASNDALTVTSSAPQATAPVSGPGIQPVPAGVFWSMPLGSRVWTIYGTPGQMVAVQVYTGLQAVGGYVR